MPPILRKAFLVTVGVVIDMQKSRIPFVNIDENVFYKAVPQNRGTHLASYIEIFDDLLHVVVSQVDLSDKYNVKEAIITASHKSGSNKKKMKNKRIQGDSYRH